MSIVASFSSGLDVFKKLRETRKRRKGVKGNNKAEEEDEARLSKSLRRGPEDIGREYQHNLQNVGDMFAVGDAIAQTSLAEILLKLNTGLVGIITSFLNRDKKHVELDYQALTNLSEQSRIDTCRTLRMLFQRMSQKGSLPSADARHALQSRAGVANISIPAPEKKRRQHSVVSQNRVKTRKPVLARVVIENSSKPPQVAMVKAGERRKRLNSSNVSSRIGSNPPSAMSTPLSPPPPYDVTEEPSRPVVQRSHTAPEIPKAKRKASVPTMRNSPSQTKPEALRSPRSTPRLDVQPLARHESPPEGPGTEPNLPANHRHRKPTPTFYSMASDSTKLGEIPLHKWAEPFDFDAMSLVNRQAAKNGWAANQADEGKKKRNGLFKLFKRK